MASTNPSEFIPCSKCACFSLRKATRAITQTYDTKLQEVGLRVTQFSLMVIAQHQGVVSISQAAELMVMDRTTLTRNLKPLEKRGWIAVNPGKDRRTKAIVVTEEGRTVLGRAMPLWEQAQVQLVKSYGDKRFESLLMDLADLVQVARK